MGHVLGQGLAEVVGGLGGPLHLSAGALSGADVRLAALHLRSLSGCRGGEQIRRLADGADAARKAEQLQDVGRGVHQGAVEPAYPVLDEARGLVVYARVLWRLVVGHLASSVLELVNAVRHHGDGAQRLLRHGVPGEPQVADQGRKLQQVRPDLVVHQGVCTLQRRVLPLDRLRLLAANHVGVLGEVVRHPLDFSPGLGQDLQGAFHAESIGDLGSLAGVLDLPHLGDEQVHQVGGVVRLRDIGVGDAQLVQERADALIADAALQLSQRDAETFEGLLQLVVADVALRRDELPALQVLHRDAELVRVDLERPDLFGRLADLLEAFEGGEQAGRRHQPRRPESFQRRAEDRDFRRALLEHGEARALEDVLQRLARVAFPEQGLQPEHRALGFLLDPSQRLGGLACGLGHLLVQTCYVRVELQQQAVCISRQGPPPLSDPARPLWRRTRLRSGLRSGSSPGANHGWREQTPRGSSRGLQLG